MKKKYYIKISWYDSFDQERKESLVEDINLNPLVCSIEQGKQNLVAIQENIELEKSMWNKRGLKSTKERSALIKNHKDKDWFCFDTFIGLLKADGSLDFAVSKNELVEYAKEGRNWGHFYRPDFYYIKLLGEVGLTVCNVFWFNNEHCEGYSAELVEVTPIEEKLKITW